MAISLVTSYAPVSNKNASTLITIPNVTASAGDSILLFIAGGLTSYDRTDEPVWGSETITGLLGGGNDGGRILEQFCFFRVVTGGTHDLVISFNSNPFCAVATAQVWSTVANDASEDLSSTANSGNSTTPTTIASPTLAAASEAQIGVVVTSGPVEDTAGTWGNSLTADRRGGSTGGVAATNITLSTAYRILTSNAAVTSSKSGITQRSWLASTVTLKELTVSAGAYSRLGISTGIGIGV